MHHRFASSLVRCDLVLYVDSEIVIIQKICFEFDLLCFIIALFVCCDVLDRN